MAQYTDVQVEEMWKELGNKLFVEASDFYKNESDAADYEDDMELVLHEDWLHFSAGEYREEIWQWFDQNHSKGVAYLMFG